MAGGLGNDLYVVDNAGDVITEAADAGIDAVLASVSYTLTDNVENLALLVRAVTATGNALNNSLLGNAAANTLYGLDGNDSLNGGTGADTMLGGLGNDTYVVDNKADKVIEVAASGIDLVTSSVTYVLADNLENLSLIGNKAIDGSGNAAANVLKGNGAANSLCGFAGNDSLTGGSGADVLVGGLGKDKISLAETIAAGDKVVVAAGDSLLSGYDSVTVFKLGDGVAVSVIDQLDLDSTSIASNQAGVNGVDVSGIKSHAISNGIIRFDDADSYSAALTVSANTVATALAYVQANVVSGETVAFTAAGNTYVFQDSGVNDTVVQLTGVLATNLNTTGLVADGVWLV